MLRLFRRLLSYGVPLAALRPTGAPYAVRFKRFVVLALPGAGVFEITHEQAKELAEQLSPTLTQR